MRNFIFASITLLCLSCFGLAQSDSANGSGTGRGIGPGNKPAVEVENRNIKTERKRERNEQLMILFNPRPAYTVAARKNQVEGGVYLRVEFKKNGQIGRIKVIKALPDGLTEQAIIAAKNIKFLPQRKSGKDVTVTKVIQFNFDIY